MLPRDRLYIKRYMINTDHKTAEAYKPPLTDPGNMRQKSAAAPRASCHASAAFKRDSTSSYVSFFDRTISEIRICFAE